MHPCAREAQRGPQGSTLQPLRRQPYESALARAIVRACMFAVACALSPQLTLLTRVGGHGGSGSSGTKARRRVRKRRTSRQVRHRSRHPRFPRPTWHPVDENKPMASPRIELEGAVIARVERAERTSRAPHLGRVRRDVCEPLGELPPPRRARPRCGGARSVRAAPRTVSLAACRRQSLP